MQNNHHSSKILGNSNIQGQSQVQNNIQPIDENNWAKSQVLQAIMLKPELGQYHQMIDSTINEKYQIIATGSLTGDIILWDYSQNKSYLKDEVDLEKQQNTQEISENLIPYQFLVPCLSQSVGQVTAMLFIENHIIQYLDQSKICLFTVHLDNRVRLWNIQDGRCFNISSHQMFKGQINYAIPLRENYSRFILLGGTRGILYVFDTWTMKEISILQLSKEEVIFQICGIQIDYKNKYIYVIDSNNEIYQISYQDFDKVEYNIYENFVKQQHKYDKEIQQSKLHVEYKLKLQHMEKPTDLLYDEKNDLLIIPVEQNIYFYKKSNLIEKMVQQKEEDELKKQRAKQFQLEFMKFNETFFKGNNYTQQLEDIDKKKKEDEKNKKPEVLLNYLILQNYAKYQYQDIKIVYHNGQQYYLISTKEGSAFVLSYSSLLKLFEVIELAKPDDVNFSFPGFSFYKSSNQCYAQVTFKMVEIVTRAEGDSNNPKLEEYLQKQVININQVTMQNKYSNLFSFDLLNSNYESYNLAEFIDKNIEKIDVILGSYKIQLQQIQEQDEKQQDLAKIHENYYKNPFSKEEMEEQSLIELKSNGYILICKIEKKVALNSSLLELNTTGISLTTKVPEICSFKFKNLTIGPNLKNSFNIFHPKFKEDFKQAFEDHIQEDIVTITQTGFIDEKDPIFFVGTSSGMVYAFPLLYSLNKNYYQFFKLNLKSHQEEQNKIGIVFMQLINNNLIISQENGFLTVLNLENLILIQQIDVQNQEQQQQQNQNEKESALEKTFVINDLSNQIILQSKLNMPIKRIKKIQILESLLKECQDKELIQLGKQTINNQFALIQMNNNITIISTEKKEVEYELRDPGQGSIYIVFYHFIMDYYVILTSNGYLHFWSLGSGRFERTELVNNYKQIFDIESLIYKNQQGIIDTNRFYYFEKQQPQISQYHSILEFQNRYHESVVNMFEENSKIEKTHNRHGFETLGDLSKIQLEDENLSHLIWSLLERIHLQNLSLGKKVGMNILKVHMNPQRTENYYNSNNILYVDCKFHNNKIQELFENSNDKSEHKLFSYMPYLFPWGANAKLDEEATKKLRIKRSVIQYEVGVIGLANCFSFSMKKAYQQQQMEKQQDLQQLVGQNKNESQEIKQIDDQEVKNTNQDEKQIEQSQIYNKESNQFSISSFVTSNISVAILLNLHQRRQIKNSSQVQEIILRVWELLTKNKKQVSENFQKQNCLVLSRFSIDNSNFVMNSAMELIIFSIRCKEQNYQNLKQIMQFLQDENNYRNEHQDLNTSSINIIEMVWLIYINYIAAQDNEQKQQIPNSLQNIIINGINFKLCLQNPNLVAICMKIISESKDNIKIQDYKVLLRQLMYIYFHYNTSKESLDILTQQPGIKVKRKILEMFYKQSPQTRQRMKIMTIRTIIHISKIDLKEFFSLIKTEITQIENHQLYPCSVIDIIKNFIKQSFADAQKHLPFFIEIILKSLDPNQPSQRKICHQSANTALQTICLQYQNVSFLGQEQKLAVGAYNQTGQSQIIIYDLRQASKWLLLEGHQGPVAAVKFDSKGKHIASFSFVDKQIKIWKVGQTGFFGSILNMSSKKIKSFNINNSFNDINRQKTTLQWSNDDKCINLQVGDLPPFQFKL